MENWFGFDLLPVKNKSISLNSLVASQLLDVPAKSGKEENSIENETNGARMPEAASLGTFLLTLIAELDGAAATATALKSSEINIADQ